MPNASVALEAQADVVVGVGGQLRILAHRQDMMYLDRHALAGFTCWVNYTVPVHHYREAYPNGRRNRPAAYSNQQYSSQQPCPGTVYNTHH